MSFIGGGALVLGINYSAKGEKKESVLTIQVGDNLESSKYNQLSVLNELKNRVKDILILCADGLSESKKLTVLFRKQNINNNIVSGKHTNMFPDKDREMTFATDLKPSIRHRTKRKLWQPMSK